MFLCTSSITLPYSKSDTCRTTSTLHSEHSKFLKNTVEYPRTTIKKKNIPKQTKSNGIPTTQNVKLSKPPNPTIRFDKDCYIIQSFISTAVYGNIYLAYDINHQCNVAIKILHYTHILYHISFYEEEECSEDVKQEILIHRYLAKFTQGHPNIIKMYNDFYSNGYLYLIFEYCPNGDLSSYLQMNAYDGFYETTAMHYFMQIVNGVHYLHQHKIAHRDLTLENILFNKELNLCKISDFGLANQFYEKSSKINGKNLYMAYMAPEISLGIDYDPIQADIWSLGIILFIMLTGHPLMEIAKEWDPRYRFLLKEQHLHTNPIATLLEHWYKNVMISPEVVTLLNQMLQISPIKRISILEINDSLIKWKKKTPD